MRARLGGAVVAVLAALAGCRHRPEGGPGEKPPPSSRYAEGADPACVADARAKVPKDAPDAERRFQELYSRCLGPDIDSAVAVVTGRIEVDTQRLSRQLLEDKLTPAQFVAGMRDRGRKLVRAERENEYAHAVAEADADNDLIPDGQDRCPNTPELAATDANGCPLNKLPEAPSRESVQRLIQGSRFLVSPACQGSGRPQTPAPVSLGFDRSVFRSPLGLCFPSRELCNDGVDNDCNDQVDEGCPTRPVVEIVVVPVQNQPAGCLVMYQLELLLMDTGKCAPEERPCATTNRPTYRTLVFRSFEAQPGPTPGTIRFVISSDSAFNHFHRVLRGFNRLRWRARAINGSGHISDWSEPHFDVTLNLH